MKAYYVEVDQKLLGSKEIHIKVSRRVIVLSDEQAELIKSVEGVHTKSKLKRSTRLDLLHSSPAANLKDNKELQTYTMKGFLGLNYQEVIKSGDAASVSVVKAIDLAQ